MDAGLPCMEFEAYRRIASSVAKTKENRASSRKKQQISPFQAQFHRPVRLKPDRLLGNGVVGITLGYAILVLQGRLTRPVLAHELRHVAQFEQSGSITAFLEEYLRQVFEYGYRDAPLEVEARGYEGAAYADSTVN